MAHEPKSFQFFIKNTKLKHITYWCLDCDWERWECTEGAYDKCPACQGNLCKDRIIRLGGIEVYWMSYKDRFFIRYPDKSSFKMPLPRTGLEESKYTARYPVTLWKGDVLEVLLFVMKHAEEVWE